MPLTVKTSTLKSYPGPIVNSLDSGEELKRFLEMNRQLQQSYEEKMILLKRRQISIKTEILKMTAARNKTIRDIRVTAAGMKKVDENFKPGESLAYFQPPYLFDKKNRSSPYENYEKEVELEDGSTASMRNLLNEKKELLFPFRTFSTGEQLNYKQEKVLRRILRRQIEGQMKEKLKAEIVEKAQIELNTEFERVAKGEIDMEDFQGRWLQNNRKIYTVQIQ